MFVLYHYKSSKRAELGEAADQGQDEKLYPQERFWMRSALSIDRHDTTRDVKRTLTNNHRTTYFSIFKLALALAVIIEGRFRRMWRRGLAFSLSALRVYLQELRGFLLVCLKSLTVFFI